MTRKTILALPLFAALTASAQDSVSTTPGTPDALSAYDGATQTTRYVLDLTPVTSSWGNGFAVGPVIKTSVDPDPMFDTQLVGAVAVSPDRLESVALSGPTDFALWTMSGAGVNPALNSAPGSTSVSMFDTQFAVAIADLSAGPTNAIGAIVGTTAEPNRLYVTRTVGASSRFTSVTADNATVSLGAIDANGLLYLRADAFNTDASTSPISGDNILSVDLASRSGFVNGLLATGGSNSSLDAASTEFLLDDSAVTLNTPALAPSSLGYSAAVAFDFANNAIKAETGSSATIASHLDAGIDAHRGNPSTSLTSGLSGDFAVASLAQSTAGGGVTDSINAFTLDSSGNVVVTSGATLPSPIAEFSNGSGFSTNSAGDATFHQYLSQQSFRGANGQAAVGNRVSSGLPVVAATALDPTDSEFIAAADSLGNWLVVAHNGKDVLDSPGGSSIGTLSATPPASISSPAIDALGNVYFVASFDPTVGPIVNGLFKATFVTDHYQLELLLKEGDTIDGANSNSTYTIDTIILDDGDSLASGSFYAMNIMPMRTSGYAGNDPQDPRSFTAASIGAVITYDNNGTPESYDALLLIAPDQAVSTVCPGDCDNNGQVNFSDLVAMLGEFGTPGSNPGCDADASGSVNFSDLVAALGLFGPCP